MMLGSRLEDDDDATHRRAQQYHGFAAPVARARGGEMTLLRFALVCHGAAAAHSKAAALGGAQAAS